MFFSKYLLATAIVEMLGELPQWEWVRKLRQRAQEKRLTCMRAIGSWHVSEFRKIDVAADPERWWRHKAKAKRWHHRYRRQKEQLEQFAEAA
ncbi:MAG TPA: hypothetical protein VFP46_00850 [Candidatus Paceibacterota bacterium]|nr:hypothetical protein [Candidatus Paceibacterota bacterium]